MIKRGDLVLVDTSVVLKWFHANGEADVEEARSILDAHVHTDITTLVLDLTLYELGNILIRSLRWAPDDAADQLDDLVSICGPPLIPDGVWHRATAQLAARHELTFYDAAFAAAADAVGATLVSADHELIVANLARSASAVAAELESGGTHGAP